MINVSSGVRIGIAGGSRDYTYIALKLIGGTIEERKSAWHELEEIIVNINRYGPKPNYPSILERQE